MESDVHMFKTFLLSQGESSEPFQMDVALLGAYLSKHIQQMKRNAGDEREPQTVKDALYSIERTWKSMVTIARFYSKGKPFKVPHEKNVSL